MFRFLKISNIFLLTIFVSLGASVDHNEPPFINLDNFLREHQNSGDIGQKLIDLNPDNSILLATFGRDPESGEYIPVAPKDVVMSPDQWESFTEAIGDNLKFPLSFVSWGEGRLLKHLSGMNNEDLNVEHVKNVFLFVFNNTYDRQTGLFYTPDGTPHLKYIGDLIKDPNKFYNQAARHEQNQAARKIQDAWRGHNVRQKLQAQDTQPDQPQAKETKSGLGATALAGLGLAGLGLAGLAGLREKKEDSQNAADVSLPSSTNLTPRNASLPSSTVTIPRAGQGGSSLGVGLPAFAQASASRESTANHAWSRAIAPRTSKSQHFWSRASAPLESTATHSLEYTLEQQASSSSAVSPPASPRKGSVSSGYGGDYSSDSFDSSSLSGGLSSRRGSVSSSSSVNSVDFGGLVGQLDELETAATKARPASSKAPNTCSNSALQPYISGSLPREDEGVLYANHNPTVFTQFLTKENRQRDRIKEHEALARSRIEDQRLLNAIALKPFFFESEDDYEYDEKLVYKPISKKNINELVTWFESFNIYSWLNEIERVNMNLDTLHYLVEMLNPHINFVANDSTNVGLIKYMALVESATKLWSENVETPLINEIKNMKDQLKVASGKVSNDWKELNTAKGIVDKLKDLLQQEFLDPQLLSMNFETLNYIYNILSIGLTSVELDQMSQKDTRFYRDTIKHYHNYIYSKYLHTNLLGKVSNFLGKWFGPGQISGSDDLSFLR